MVVRGQPYEVMWVADLALTTSGTTTLELAAHGVPMVIAYRVSPILYGIGRVVVKVDHIGLVNLIAGRGIVPEHIGTGSLKRVLVDDLLSIRTDVRRRMEMIAAMSEVRSRLNDPGSYERAAARIAEFIAERRT